MTAKRKIKALAKLMFKGSLVSNQLDHGKIRTLVQKLIKDKPQGYLKILKAYKRLVGQLSAKEEVLVESASPLDKAFEKEMLSKTKAAKVRYKINKDMVIGAKITHGDWIYEASLDAKLKQLTTE